MATITFTYADSAQADFRDALAEYGGGYQATITDAEGNSIPNPQTKAQFAREVARKVLLQIYKNWKARQAEAAAKITAESSAESGLNIT